MRKFLQRLAAVSMVLASVAAHAAFEVRDTRFGQSTGVYDTVTGTEWLRMDVTRGKSYNEVASQLTTTYAGYQIAGAELDNLIGRWSLYWDGSFGCDCWSQTQAQRNDAFAFMTAMGAQVQPGRLYLDGFTNWGAAADPNAPDYQGGIYLEPTSIRWAPDRASFYDDSMAYKPVAYADRSVWMVAAPVPEPETYALMALGLLAVAVRRRKARGLQAD